MSDSEVRAQVDAFVALPRAERRKVYPTLPRDVQMKARRIIEARRGIAYRTQGGDMVLTKEEYKRQIDVLNKKIEESDARKEALIAKKVEFEARLQENYGETVGNAE